MDKTVKLEWHKLSNTRTRCLRITQRIWGLHHGQDSKAGVAQAWPTPELLLACASPRQVLQAQSCSHGHLALMLTDM